MKIEPIEHGLVLSKPTEGYVRTPGLHVSDLYSSLYKGLNPKRYDKRGPDGEPLPFDDLRTQLGSTFEDALEPILRKRIVTAERPGEYVTQHSQGCGHTSRPAVSVGDAVCACGAGVIYSPDHFLFNGVFRLGEFKLTWMSIGKGIRDPRFDKYQTQMQAYCYHLGTRYARLYAFFVNGDYTNHSPQLRAWDIEYSQKELDETWAMLVRQGRKDGVIPDGPA